MTDGRGEAARAGGPLPGLVVVLGAGLVALALYALQFDGKAPGLVMGYGSVLAGAAALVGGLLGFLFGIPRTQTSERAPTSSAENERETRPSYLPNTNLEQISDWLTKILVGVGLTQVSSVPGAVRALGDFVATGLGSHATSAAFGVALVVYFLVSGSLLSYLWTRLYFSGLLRLADAGTIERVVARQVERQSDLDARALSLAEQHLTRRAGEPEVPEAELTDAIKKASPLARQQIFFRAHQVRTMNWMDRKSTMERAVPIFRALVAADSDDLATHGELGFALKDQRQPDWRGAEAELSKAIELRGPNAFGWEVYEFNRAWCRIEQDPAFRQRRPSSPDRRSLILSDLRIAAQSNRWRPLISSDEPFKTWLEVNGVEEFA